MITLLLLVRATYMYGVVLHAHPVPGESHNQRNTTEEVATTLMIYGHVHRHNILSFYGSAKSMTSQNMTSKPEVLKSSIPYLSEKVTINFRITS